jgi:hypothetical protein
VIANILIAAFSTCTGIVIGAYVLDQYHERHRLELEVSASDTAAELIAMRELYARSEAMLDAVSRECALLKAQRSQVEALHAERIRRTMEDARWN